MLQFEPRDCMIVFFHNISVSNRIRTSCPRIISQDLTIDSDYVFQLITKLNTKIGFRPQHPPQTFWPVPGTVGNWGWMITIIICLLILFLGWTPSFNGLLCLELVKKFVWYVILNFRFTIWCQYFTIRCQSNVYWMLPEKLCAFLTKKNDILLIIYWYKKNDKKVKSKFFLTGRGKK